MMTAHSKSLPISKMAKKSNKVRSIADVKANSITEELLSLLKAIVLLRAFQQPQYSLIQ